MIRDFMIALTFGPLGAVLALVISGIGIIKNKFWVSLVGALLFIPFTYYLFGSPGLLRGFVLLLPLFQFGSALAVQKKRSNLAWLLLAPSALMLLWVVGVALVYSIGTR